MPDEMKPIVSECLEWSQHDLVAMPGEEIVLMVGTRKVSVGVVPARKKLRCRIRVDGRFIDS